MTDIVLHTASAPSTADFQTTSYALSEDDALHAFESFLRIDVANGDATQDTVRAYRRHVGLWVEWCRAHGVHPAYARRSDVESYREELKARGISVATRRLKLSVIRRFYAAGIKHGLWRENPAEDVKAGKDLTAPEENMKALSEVGLKKLLDQVPGSDLAGARNRAIIALMALHGLRRIEVHRLDHEHLQNDENEGNAPYLKVIGKGGKLRRIYLREDTLTVLEAYTHAKLSAQYPLSGAIFVGHWINGRGRRLTRQALSDVVNKYLSAASLKRVGLSSHALRHTFGTLSVAGGAKIEHLREAMGHASVGTTSIYVRAVERAKNNPSHSINVSAL